MDPTIRALGITNLAMKLINIDWNLTRISKRQYICSCCRVETEFHFIPVECIKVQVSPLYCIACACLSPFNIYIFHVLLVPEHTSNILD